MPDAPQLLNTSADRGIGMRTRPDLIVQAVTLQGESCWVVKDPLSMKFFRLQEAEYLVFEALREKTSYRQLKELLERRFPEASLRQSAVQQLVVQMQRMGLLVSDSQGQAYELQYMRAKEKQRKTLGGLASIVSMRFPGMDPDRQLSFLHGKLRWMFTGWFTCLALLICLSALLLVVANLEEFYARLPDFQTFFGFENLLLMFGILIFTKSMHELGHGLMCKHFGGECHEIGFMLLVFTPAMYCNTSDSWILPNRWHRIAIGAAGMYVELCMAAVCTFIWWYTHPGWVHYLALNIMFLGSVSTLLFNANPLLRYDGYYMLSDFLEIPNLSQKSRLAMLSQLRVWALGLKPINHRQLPKQNRFWFASYSVASLAYRWFVVIAIFWFLRAVLEPYGLEVLANLMVSLSLFGMLVVPVIQAIKFMSYPGRFREVNKYRFTATVAVVLLVCSAISLVPIPQLVFGYARIRPYDAQTVMVTVEGRLKEIRVRPGEHVEPGDVIVTLSNAALELELLDLVGELETAKSDLENFELNRRQMLDAERLIAETAVTIRNLESAIEIKQRALERLVLRADRAGVVILAENIPRKPAGAAELQTWDGTPLDPVNLGAMLSPNTIVCMVAEPGHYEASVVVDQADIKLVAADQDLSLMLEQSPGKRFRGKVIETSQEALTVIPRELSQSTGGPIAAKPSADGREKPLFTSYEVYSRLVESEAYAGRELGAGFHGTAKIHAGYATLGSITLRHLRNLINFR